MKESYSTRIMFLSTDEQVSKLMELGREEADPAALVKHQLDAPLDFDLSSVRLTKTQQKRAGDSITQATRSSINTFRDLFTNPEAPLELLKLSQKFFKQRVASELNASPRQRVFYLFYLLSIAVARIRWGVNISRLTEGEQLHAINSMMKRSWIDGEVRELFADAAPWHRVSGPCRRDSAL